MWLFHQQGRCDERDLEIGKLALLVQHLRRIETYDKSLLRHFRKQIYDSAHNWENYFGVRMEINVAASLVKKGIRFMKGESPDFTVPSSGVSIECGSAHVQGPKYVHPLAKLRSVIADKASKPYSNSNTALFLDFTNIQFALGPVPDERAIRKSEVVGILDSLGASLGSVVCFCYFMADDKTFQSNYSRMDAHSISHELSAFLNAHYPFGRLDTGPGWAPFRG